MDRVLERWRRTEPRVDTRTAEAVLAALLHGTDAGEIASALLEFDPNLPVDLDSLRTLRIALVDELERVDTDPPVVGRLFAALDDLFERVAARDVRRLEVLTLVDALTGLGNRRGADADLRSVLAHAERYGRMVTIAVIDLDGLKTINDTHGHAAGDAALRRLGEAIRGTARVDDGAYRTGGDEFLIIAPDSSSNDVERLLARLIDLAPAFSAGIASAPHDATQADDLIAVADRRLYERKPRRQRVPSPIETSRIALTGVFLVASLAAELVRRVFRIELVGDRRVLWGMLILGAPLLVAFGGHLPPAFWRVGAERRQVAERAAILTLALLAALVPLVRFD